MNKKNPAVHIIASVFFLVLSLIGIWASATSKAWAEFGAFLVLSNFAVAMFFNGIAALDIEKRFQRLRQELQEKE